MPPRKSVLAWAAVKTGVECRPEDMEANIERDLGPQPLKKILEKSRLSHHDLVVSSSKGLTHKMVSRGCKGRRLTKNVQQKVLEALNQASGETFGLEDLFNYKAIR